MMRRILLALLALCWATGAFAQSNPGLRFGQVPTAAQWNSYFSAKQDYLGFTPVHPGSIVGSTPIVVSSSGGVITISCPTCLAVSVIPARSIVLGTGTSTLSSMGPCATGGFPLWTFGTSVVPTCSTDASSVASINGNLSLTAVTSNIIMGSTASSNTPYIAFNSSGTASLYDSRLIASGGDVTGVGRGLISLVGSLSVLPQGGLTLQQGLLVEVPSPAGNQASYFPNYVNCGLTLADAVNAGGAPANGCLAVQHHFGGAAMQGGRHVLSVTGVLTAQDSISNILPQYVGIASLIVGNVNDRGTDLASLATTRGAIYGINPFASLVSAATYWSAVTGGEFNIQMADGSSAWYASVLSLAAADGHHVQGYYYDAGLALSAQGDPFVATISINAVAGVITTPTPHLLSVNNPVRLATTGALPTGLSPNVIYYVAAVNSSTAFTVKATLVGSPIPTSGSQSGIQYLFTGALGSNVGIMFGPMNGSHPVDAAGTLIATTNKKRTGYPDLLPAVVNKGIDFTSYAFTTASIDMPGFRVTGAGNFSIATTLPSIIMSSAGIAGTLFVKDNSASDSTFMYIDNAATGRQGLIGWLDATNGIQWYLGKNTTNDFIINHGTAVSGDMLKINAAGTLATWAVPLLLSPTSSQLKFQGTATTGTLTWTTTSSDKTITFPNTTGTVALTGGANIPSVVTGDMLYANGTNSLTTLAAAAANNALLSGTAPSWGKITSSYLNITGTTCTAQFIRAISTAAAGTCETVVLTADVTGRLPFANLTQIAGVSVLGVTGSSTANVAGIAGTAYQVLRLNSAGTALAFGSIDLSRSEVVDSSVLGPANGGTGVANNAASTITITGSFPLGITLAASTSISFSSAGALAVANGGTGQITLLNHGVLVGAGTSGVTALAVGVAGTVLVGVSATADPIFSATPTLGINGVVEGVLGIQNIAGGQVTIHPATASFTNYNFNLPTTAGAAGQVLTSQNGGTAAMTWTTPGTGTVTSITASSPLTGGVITTSGSIGCTTCVTSAAALTSGSIMTGAGSQASQVTTTGTGVVTALGVNVGSAGAFVVNGGALGTPSSGTLTNATGLPTTGLTGTLQAAQFPALTGDITTSAGSLATTLATVASAGTTGGSTAIPVITINAKGLTTSISTAAVIAPAGTLTGATLASGVTASSLTSVGTLTGGATGAGFTVALGTSTITGVLTVPNGGTGFGSYAVGQILYADTSTTLAGLTAVATGNVIISGGLLTAPQWNKVTSSHLNITPTTCTNQFVRTITSNGTGTCATVALGSDVSGTLLAAQFPALTGDITTSAGSLATTLATVASAGTTGGSTAIPVITINAKGLTTSISTAAVIAPAGTLTGATLASGVTASSLTSVGTLTGGATGAGFTIALSTSTITGTLPAAQMPALTGDITTSAGTVATTLATVASAGTTGGSTAIPVITINAKGLTTSISTAAVIAPAGTLTGATLASGVLASSLTSVGTLTGGATGAGFTVALGTSTITGTLTVPNGGTGQPTLTLNGVLVGNGTSAIQQTAAGVTGQIFIAQTSSAPIWTAGPTIGGPATGATGIVGFAGVTGGVVRVQSQDSFTTYNFNLPATAGTSGQALLSGGGVSSAPMTWATIREVLAAPRIYYVRADGSDSLCNGLGDAASPGPGSNGVCAWRTPQKAADVIMASLDLGGQIVTVQLRADTYTGGMTWSSAVVGGGTILIQGESGAKTSVVVQRSTATAAFEWSVPTSTAFFIKYLRIGGSATLFGINVVASVGVSFQEVDFAAVASAQVRAQSFGIVSRVGDYTISGGGAFHWLVQQGQINGVGPGVVTGSGNFSAAFVVCKNLGFVSAESMDFSGVTSTSTQKFQVNLNAVIYTGTGNINYFPGDAAGIVNPGLGGLYL